MSRRLMAFSGKCGDLVGVVELLFRRAEVLMVKLPIADHKFGIVVGRRINHDVEFPARLHGLGGVRKGQSRIVGARWHPPAKREVECLVQVGSFWQDPKQVQFLYIPVEAGGRQQGMA